jgi:hypothetical protein
MSSVEEAARFLAPLMSRPERAVHAEEIERAVSQGYRLWQSKP